VGDLALYHEVPLSGSCKYMQPPPKFLPAMGTGLLVGNHKLCSLTKMLDFSLWQGPAASESTSHLQGPDSDGKMRKSYAQQ